MTIKPKITGYKDGWRFEKDASKLEVKMVLTEHRPRLGVTLPLPLNSCITSVYLSLFELAPKAMCWKCTVFRQFGFSYTGKQQI